MKMTAIDIQNKQFKVRFRGFDLREVDLFLEEMADAFEVLNNENNRLTHEVKRLENENKAYKEREETLNNTLIHSQKIVEQMKENAQKSSDLIIAEAEVKAEKLLQNAHNRLSHMHDEISELKRQRMQIEIQISSILDSHSKLLERGKTERDEEDDKIKKVIPSLEKQRDEE